MALEDQYPALAAHIQRLRNAGIDEEQIQATIREAFAAAKRRGYTPSQIEGMAARGLRNPRPSLPTDWRTQGAAWEKAMDAHMAEVSQIGQPPEDQGIGSAFGQGVLRGLTFGYKGSASEDHPLATIAGELVGGVVPGAALFAATGPIGGIASGLASSAQFAPMAARIGPTLARLGMAGRGPGITALEQGAQGIGLLAREAATGAAFGGIWNPEGGGAGQRLEQSALGAATAPPLGLALRASGRGLGLARRRLWPGVQGEEAHPVRSPLALPSPGPYEDPWRPSSGAARPMPGEGQRMFQRPRLALPPGPSRVTGRPPVDVGPSGETIPMGGDILSPSPTADAARAFRAESAEIQQISDTIARLERAGQPVPGFLRRTLESARRRVPFGTVSRETPPGEPPVQSPPPGPSPPRHRAVPRVPIIMSSGTTGRRPVTDLGLASLLDEPGVSVEFIDKAGQAGLRIRRGPDGQIETVSSGMGIATHPEESEAIQHVQGVLAGTGPVPQQPVQRITGGSTSTLDKDMLGHPRGVADSRNAQEQRILNARSMGELDLEARGDPAAVDPTPMDLGVLPKGTMGVRSAGTQEEVEALYRSAVSSGYKVTVIQIPGKGNTLPTAELIYYWQASPNVSRALQLYRRIRLKGPEGISPQDQAFLGKMMGKSEGTIAAKIAARVPPGPSKEPVTISEEEQADLIRSMESRAAAEDNRDLLRILDMPEERSVGADIDFQFGANVPKTPPGEARHVRITGRRKGASGRLDEAAERQRAKDKLDVSGMTQRMHPDLSADFLVESNPPLMQRLGIGKGATIGDLRRAAGLPVPKGTEPGIDPLPSGHLGPLSPEAAAVAKGEITKGGLAATMPRPPLGLEGAALLERKPKLGMPWIQPQQSQNPLINEIGLDFDKAAFATYHPTEGEIPRTLASAKVRIFDKVGGKGTKASARAYDLVSGELDWDQGTRPEREAAQAYREDMQRSARASGTTPWLNYATKVTDFETIYQALREHFAGKTAIDQLDPKVQFRIKDPGRFAHFRKIFQGFPEWERVPKAVRTELKDLWNFRTVADKWDEMPEFIQRLVPKEIGDPYLLPRVGDAPFKRDIVEAYQHYMPLLIKKVNFDPVLERWTQFLDTLPGPDLPLTEKRYMRSYMEGRVLKRPTPTDKTISYLVDRINTTIGHEMLNMEGINAAVTLFRSGFYRGALGIDSALNHASKIINSWAMHGKVVGPIFQHFGTYQDLRAKGLIGQWSKLITEDFPSGPRSPLIDKVLRFDDKMNKVFLSPMALSESVGVGAAFSVGMEEAAAKGLSPAAMLVNAYSRGVGIVPPAQMSEQIQHALFRVVPQIQFGKNPTQLAPAFRGTLGRLTNILVTYPTQEAAFQIRGMMESGKATLGHLKGRDLAEGFAEAIAAGDAGRLARFTATLGAFALLPFVIYETLGYGIKETWGLNSVLDLTFNPFWTGIRNGYASLIGFEMATKTQARQELWNFFKTITIPQYRWGKKLQDVTEGISRGYAVDRQLRYIYDTSPAGELMRLAGIRPPERMHADYLSRKLMEESYKYRRDKRTAIAETLDGNQDAAGEFQRKWGESLTPQDMLRAQRERMTRPEQRAGRGLPQLLRERLTEEFGG